MTKQIPDYLRPFPKPNTEQQTNPQQNNLPNIETTESSISTEEVIENNGDKENSKTRLPKGSKPPFLNLEESVKLIQEIYERAGGGVSFDGFSQISTNSPSSSSFTKKIGVLRSFGLITAENKSVILTVTADNIVAPRSPQERARALKSAFCNNDIFSKVYSQFKGRLLPQDEFLVNTFKDLVPRDIASKWMTSFKESALYANLLLDRGDGKFQVIEDNLLAEQTKTVENGDIEEIEEEENNSSIQVSEVVAEAKQQEFSAPKDAIKTVQLRNSKKEIWLGSNANIVEIEFGEDLEFVIALSKLFSLYANKKKFEIKEVKQATEYEQD